MFVFFPIFLIFLIVLTYFLRKNNRKQDEIEQNFWRREQEANFSRKKDLSTLEYIRLSPELIPGNLHTDAEQALLSMTDTKMLNLTRYTNTDLKMQYGPANLDALSEFESNYISMITRLIVYAEELIQSGQQEAAQKLLEFAIACQDDSVRIYEKLANIYQANGNESGLTKLLDSARNITSINRKTILEKLESYASQLPQ